MLTVALSGLLNVESVIICVWKEPNLKCQNVAIDHTDFHQQLREKAPSDLQSLSLEEKEPHVRNQETILGSSSDIQDASGNMTEDKDSMDLKDIRSLSGERKHHIYNPEKPENEGSGFCEQRSVALFGLKDLKEKFSSSHSEGQTEKLFRCFFCGTTFLTAGLLTIHTTLHTGEKLPSCIICNKTFSLESNLANHTCAGEFSEYHQSQNEEQVVSDKLLSCSQCGEAFSGQEELNLHLKGHSRKLKCSICAVSCSDRDSLIQHMRIHTRQTQFNCSVCGKDFAWRRHLTKHMEVHKKRKKVFRCRICAAEFYTYYLLSKHKLLHQSSDPADGLPENKEEEQMEATAEEEDGSEPTGISNPEAQMSIKTEHFGFSEHIDSDFFPERDNEVSQNATKPLAHREGIPELQKEVKQEELHPQIKDEQEETVISKLHFSPVCLKAEDDEEKPQLSRLHHAEESAATEAEVDGGTPEFSDADTDDSNCWKAENVERKVQSGSNSESDSGRNSFSQVSGSLQPKTDDSVDSDFWKDYRKPQSNLNALKHETSEAGVKYVTDLKPYSCTQCSKAFRYSSYLKIHMRQHTERYFCSVCGHKSTSSSNLKVHMRTHTGEKPFSCEICNKKYTNKASMQAHMSVHNAERKYSCDVCKKNFAWFTELKYHQCVGESSLQQSYEEDAGINLKRHILYNLNE